MTEEWLNSVTQENIKLNDFLNSNPGLPREVYFAIKQRSIELDKIIMMALAKGVVDKD